MTTPKPIKRPPVVEVEWVDSMGYGGWADREQRIKDMDKVEDLDHITVGYLLKQTRTYVAVTQSFGRTGSTDHSMQIPRCAVKRVTTLRKAT